MQKTRLLESSESDEEFVLDTDEERNWLQDIQNLNVPKSSLNVSSNSIATNVQQEEKAKEDPLNDLKPSNDYEFRKSDEIENEVIVIQEDEKKELQENKESIQMEVMYSVNDEHKEEPSELRIEENFDELVTCEESDSIQSSNILEAIQSGDALDSTQNDNVMDSTQSDDALVFSNIYPSTVERMNEQAPVEYLLETSEAIVGLSDAGVEIFSENHINIDRIYPSTITEINNSSESQCEANIDQENLYPNAPEIEHGLENANENNVEIASGIEMHYEAVNIDSALFYNTVNIDINAPVLHNLNEEIVNSVNCNIERVHSFGEIALIEDEIHAEEILSLAQIRIQIGYINEYMAGEQKFLNWRHQMDFKNDELYNLLAMYYEACLDSLKNEENLELIWSSLASLEKQFQEIIVEPTIHVLTCKDDRKQMIRSERSTVRRNPKIEQQIQEKLQEHRLHFYNKNLTNIQSRAFYREGVNAYLDTLYYKFQNCSPTTQYFSTINVLKESLTTLCKFEGKFFSYESECDIELDPFLNQFRCDCRSWIRQIVARILKIATTSDHLFILVEVMKCRGIGSWGADFVQISQISTDDDVDRFLAMLSLFLMTPFSLKGDKKYILTESDFDQIFGQFHFPSIFYYLIKCCQGNLPGNRFQDLATIFSVIDTIFFILKESLILYSSNEYRSFARRIAQTISSSYQIFYDFVIENNLLENEFIVEYLKKISVTSFMSIYETNNSSNCILTLLGGLISNPLPKVISYSIFLNYFIGDNCKSLSRGIISKAFRSLKSWKTYAQFHRNKFHKSMLSNPDLFTIIPTFSQLGTQSYLLSRITCYELLELSFVQSNNDYPFSKEALPEICKLCQNYTQVIVTDIVKFIIRNAKNHSSSNYMRILKKIPIHQWNPTPKQFQIVMDSLNSPPVSPLFQISEVILSRVITSDLNEDMQRKLLLFFGQFTLNHFKSSPRGLFKQISEKDKLLYKWIEKLLLQLTLCDDNGHLTFELLDPTDPIIRPLIAAIQLNQFSPIRNILLYTVINLTSIGGNLELYSEFASLNSTHCFMKKFIQTPDLLFIRTIMDTSLKLFSYSNQQTSGMFPEVIDTFFTSNVSKDLQFFRMHLPRVIIMKVEELLLYQNYEIVEDYVFFWMKEFLLKKDSLLCDEILKVLEFISKFCIWKGLYLRLSNCLYETFQTLIENFNLETPKIFSAFGSKYPSVFRRNKNVFSKIFKPNTKYPFLGLLFSVAQAQGQASLRNEIGQKVIKLYTPIQLHFAGNASKHAIYKVLTYIILLSNEVVESSKLPISSQKPKSQDAVLLAFWKLFLDLLVETTFINGEELCIGIQYLNIPNCKEQFFAVIKKHLQELYQWYESVPSNDRYVLYTQYYKSIRNWIQNMEKHPPIKKSDLQPSFVTEGVFDLSLCIDFKSYYVKTGFWYNAMDIDHIPQDEYPQLSIIFPSKFKKNFVIKRHESIVKNTNTSTIPLSPPQQSTNGVNLFIGNDSDICNIDDLSFMVALILQKIEEVDFAYNQHCLFSIQYTKELLPSYMQETTSRTPFHFACNDRCTGPCVVNIEETKAIINSSIREDIDKKLESIKAITKANYFNNEYIIALVRLSTCVSRLIHSTNDVTEQGAQYFFILCSLLESATNAFPGFKELYEKLMEGMSQVFIEKYQHTTMKLFQRMMENPKSILPLHNFFQPKACISVWDNLFEELFSLHRKKILNSNDLYVLLIRFDINDLLSTSFHTVGQKMNNFIDIFINEVVVNTENQIPINIQNLLIDWSGKIAASRTQEWYPYIVSQLIQKSLPDQLPSSFLKKLIDENVFSDKFDIITVVETAKCISQHLWKLRNEKSLFEILNRENLEVIRQFLQEFFARIPQSIMLEYGTEVYDAACNVFGPFIFEYVNPGTSQIHLPADKSLVPKVQVFIDTFTMVILPNLCICCPSVLPLCLQLYLWRIRKNLTKEYIEKFELGFSELPWSSYCLLPYQISDILNVLMEDQRESEQRFCTRIILSIDWKLVERNVHETSTHDRWSSFYSLALQVFHYLLSSRKCSTIEVEYVRDNLDLQWKYFSTVEFDRATLNNTSWLTRELTNPTIFSQFIQLYSEASKHDHSDYNYQKPAIFSRFFFGIVDVMQMSRRSSNKKIFFDYINGEFFDILCSQFGPFSNTNNTTLQCVEVLKTYVAISNLRPKWTQQYIEKLCSIFTTTFPTLSETFLEATVSITKVDLFCYAVETVTSCMLLRDPGKRFLDLVPIFPDQQQLQIECVKKNYWLTIYSQIRRAFKINPRESHIRRSLFECILKIKQPQKGEREIHTILIYILYFQILSNFKDDPSLKKETADLSKFFLQAGFNRSLLAKFTRTKLSIPMQNLFGIFSILLLRYGGHDIQDAKDTIGNNLDIETQCLLLRSEYQDLSEEIALPNLIEAVCRHLFPSAEQFFY